MSFEWTHKNDVIFRRQKRPPTGAVVVAAIPNTKINQKKIEIKTQNIPKSTNNESTTNPIKDSNKQPWFFFFKKKFTSKSLQKDTQQVNHKP